MNYERVIVRLSGRGCGHVGSSTGILLAVT